MKLKIKLNKDFCLSLFLGLIIFLVYLQFLYSKKNLVKTYKNQKFTQLFRVKDNFKSIFDNAEILFKSKLNDNMKELNILYLLYTDYKDFDPDKIAAIINKNEQKGHYEVFLIDKNKKIVKASYKKDLGYNLGQFPVFRKILNNTFKGKEHIDVSPVYIDPSSMNLKRYFLIRSLDKKYLLQIAYVVNIYPKLKKTYFKLKNKFDDLKKLKLYFVSKYLIYPIKFDNGRFNKTPLIKLMKNTSEIFNDIIKKSNLHIYGNNVHNRFGKKVFEIFSKKEIISYLDWKNNSFEVYTMVNGFFKDLSNRLIIKTVFNTKILQKDIENLKNKYFIAVIFTILIFIFIRFVIYYISHKLNELVMHMKNNREIQKTGSFIKEIDELIYTYNRYRNRLNKEIERNKQLLMENRRFIIDTVHQIKTPLSIIILNSDFIKMNVKNQKLLEALDEIDASISMLTTSYEDLSYISSEKLVEYKSSYINISNILNERIKFFSNLAKAKDKKLIVNIEEHLKFKINKVEIERIIDNNITNAIEYSKEKEIYVKLKKENKEIIFEVISIGEKIQNPNKIFEKNYREHIHKRGLGLGLNIVKNICDKYNILYKTYYKNGSNVFEYKFKI